MRCRCQRSEIRCGESRLSGVCLRRRQRGRAVLFAAFAIVAGGAARADLAERLDAVLANKGLRGAKVGAFVVSRADGRMLYARDADLPLMPASNQKVLTEALVGAAADVPLDVSPSSDPSRRRK